MATFRKIAWLQAILASLTLTGCISFRFENSGTTNVAGAPSLTSGHYVDLSYAYGPDTLYWPTAQRFELDSVFKGPTEMGYWYEANNIATAEHGGTHMDAPVHFAKGQLSTDQVPVEAGIGPLVVVDVRDKAAADRDYRLAVGDLVGWESEHGRIPNGAIVVMFSGWGERWPDAERYLGTAVRGDTANLHFPGFGEAAIRFLIEKRQIKAIGVDTASIDYGPSRDFIVHRVLNGAGKPAFENLANVDQLPPVGATLIALPMKIAGGSGGPLRAVALLP
jgi:kynurenine formamidase